MDTRLSQLVDDGLMALEFCYQVFIPSNGYFNGDGLDFGDGWYCQSVFWMMVSG